MKLRLLALAAVAVCSLSTSALASGILLDRGLPTTNINNAAGNDRSNVAWAFTEHKAGDYWLVGDTFTNTSSQAWAIDSIRVWTMKPTATAVLWGGIDGGAIGVVSAAGSISNAEYADHSTYQGSSGVFREFHEINFAVNLVLQAGETYDFFFDGTGNSDLDHNGDPIIVPYVHASNAALSGLPQAGADDKMLEGQVVGGSMVTGSIGQWTSLGNGWSKASDLNVQVFGNAVPEPGSLALAGIALAGLASLRRRKA